MLVSANAQVWQTVNTGTGSKLRGVTWGAGTFVCVGDGGSILSSANGRIGHSERQRAPRTSRMSYMAMGDSLLSQTMTRFSTVPLMFMFPPMAPDGTN